MRARALSLIDTYTYRGCTRTRAQLRRHFQHHLCRQVKWRDAGVSPGCSDTTVDYAVPDVEVVCTRVRGVRSGVVHFSQLSFCLEGSRIYLVPLVVTFSPVCSLASRISLVYPCSFLSPPCGYISEQSRLLRFRRPVLPGCYAGLGKSWSGGDDRYHDRATMAKSVRWPLFFVSALVTARENFYVIKTSSTDRSSATVK